MEEKLKVVATITVLLLAITVSFWIAAIWVGDWSKAGLPPLLSDKLAWTGFIIGFCDLVALMLMLIITSPHNQY